MGSVDVILGSRPLNIKGQPTHDRSHVALIAQLGEHCTGNAKVVGLNPVQSLKMFPGHFPSSVMAAFASIIIPILTKLCSRFRPKVIAS